MRGELTRETEADAPAWLREREEDVDVERGADEDEVPAEGWVK